MNPVIEAYKKLKPEYRELVDRVVDRAYENPRLEYLAVLYPILLYAEQEQGLLSKTLREIKEELESSIRREEFLRKTRFKIRFLGRLY